MSVEIYLIGQAKPVDWEDEKPQRPEYVTYAYRVFENGVLGVESTRRVVDDNGYVSFHDPMPVTFYGASAWQQVTGDMAN